MLKMSSELIASDRENAGETLFKLMNHENEKVRLNAATICLQKDLYKSDARDELRRIAKESSDGIISFQASTALKIY